jgi:20S proteasome subunit alpha 4
VESGGKNIEVTMMTKDAGLRQLEEAEIDAIVAEIEAEKAAAEAAKKAPPAKDTYVRFLLFCIT